MAAPKEIVEFEGEADAIVRRHMVYAMAGGALPVPFLDLTTITAVQLDMLKQLAKHHDAPFDSRSAKAFVTTTTSALAGNVLARIGSSALKMVPGVGTVVGGVAQILFTGASTYALGRYFNNVFAQKEPVEEIDIRGAKEHIRRYYERGKEIARSMGPGRKAGK